MIIFANMCLNSFNTIKWWTILLTCDTALTLCSASVIYKRCRRALNALKQYFLPSLHLPCFSPSLSYLDQLSLTVLEILSACHQSIIFLLFKSFPCTSFHVSFAIQVTRHGSFCVMCRALAWLLLVCFITRNSWAVAACTQDLGAAREKQPSHRQGDNLLELSGWGESGTVYVSLTRWF